MLTTDRHEASRGLFATAELLVLSCTLWLISLCLTVVLSATLLSTTHAPTISSTAAVSTIYSRQRVGRRNCKTTSQQDLPESAFTTIRSEKSRSHKTIGHLAYDRLNTSIFYLPEVTSVNVRSRISISSSIGRACYMLFAAVDEHVV